MSNGGNATGISLVCCRRGEPIGRPVRADNNQKMKASTTSSATTRAGLRALDRTRRTAVALAIRDQSLSTALAARLAAQRDAVALSCPATDTAELLAWLEENRCDVLLLDERWLQRLDADALRRLRARGRRVLLVGERACPALAEQVVRHRFQGFLLAREAAAACVKAVRTVEQGEVWLPRALLVELLFEHVHAAGHGPLENGGDGKLTRREAEVVGYVRRGFANKQIADSLAIREDTVKKHLRNAYLKLGVHRRSEIITGGGERHAGN
jgi:DNA-binding NarL/FixJ family response regulator